MRKQLFFSIFIPIFFFCIFLIPNHSAKAASPFSDVTMYSSQIDYLYNQGIIKGYQNGTFRPEAPIKRLQAVQMILKQLNITDYSAPPVHFNDIKPGDYGFQQVAKAVQLGIIKGKKDGSFDPWGYLTRAQMAVIMDKAFHLSHQTETTQFKDVPSDFWAKASIADLASNGITSGYQDDTFRPNQAIQRNHFSLFLVNYLEKSNNLNTSLVKNVISNDEKSVVMIYGNDASGNPIQQGSGFFVGKGLVLTNYHVLDGASSFDIVTNDGNTYRADGIVKEDQNRDLAILKVSKLTDVPPLPLGSIDSASQGDPIVTVGSPEGLMNTVSEGIISGLRSKEDKQGLKTNVIQIDAPITHGSSGGPLFDANGKVIGINSFGYDSGGNLNFAIAIDYAKQWVTDLSKLTLDQMSVLPIKVTTPSVPAPVQAPAATPTPPPGNEGTENILMSFQPIYHIVADPNNPVLYGINTNSDILQVNYQTQTIKKMAFTNTPSSLDLYGHTLVAGLQVREFNSNIPQKDQMGIIASINTTDFSLKNKFYIPIDPNDVLTDGTSVYVSPGSGQLSDLCSFDLTTGNELSYIDRIWQQKYLIMDPQLDQLYTIDSGGTIQVDKYTIGNGKLKDHYSYPAGYSNNKLNSLMNMSPDGNYLFNGSGYVFFASHSQDTDMTYAGQLPNPYTTITFDLANNRFYTVNGNWLYEYDYKTFKLLHSYHMANQIQKLIAYKGKLYAVATVSGNKFTFVLESIKLP